jgi:NAD(P)H-hydrate epimerase
MRPILSRSEMRAFDAHAIKECRVPSLLLMENAGRGATDILCTNLLQHRVQNAHITIVCGTGNNGGDGFVVARHLRTRGALPRVLVCGAREKISGDARSNLDALEGIGVTVKYDATAGDVAECEETDVLVDALFGTGLDRPITGPLAEVVTAMNALARPTLALDLPSGMDADTGEALGPIVRATHTVTFAHAKLGLLTPEGARFSGMIHVVDIGVPGELVKHVGASAQLVQEDDVGALIVARAASVHKHTAGHVGILAGSPGKVGASLLVAQGALRAGAGAATIATFPEAFAAVTGRVLEIMTMELDTAAIAESLDRFFEGKRAIVAGPGFGVEEPARAAIEHCVRTWKGLLVLDADALTLFAGRPEALADSPADLVLTPHSGEAGRLLGKASAEIEHDRFGAARTLASKTGATVLLKGAFTVVAHAAHGTFVNPTGGPALATAGSGDVLAGIVGALGCALPGWQAAMAAAFVHGLAGEDWPTDRGMLAHDIADRIPAVLQALSTAHTERATRHTAT